MVGEVEQGLYLWLTAVEFLKGGLQLGRDIADKLGFQGVTLVGQFDDFLLFAGLEDKTHEDDSSHDQGSSKGSRQDAKTDDDGPAGGERAVALCNGCLVIGNLLLQGGYLVGMLDGAGGVFPGKVVAI